MKNTTCTYIITCVYIYILKNTIKLCGLTFQYFPVHPPFNRACLVVFTRQDPSGGTWRPGTFAPYLEQGKCPPDLKAPMFNIILQISADLLRGF